MAGLSAHSKRRDLFMEGDKVQMEVQRLSLANLYGGGAIEKFDAELLRVLDNIVDINTCDGAREVTLKVSLKPDKDRSFCAVEVSVKSKLQPEEAFGTQIFLGREGGLTTAFEHNPEQLKFGFQPQVSGNQPMRIGGKS
jgi:hypothetical protein